MTWWGKFKSEWMLVPNLLSFARGLAGVAVAWMIFAPSPMVHGVAFLLFLAAALTDFLDGFIARRFGLVTALGKFFDPAMDKVLVLVPLCVFAHMGMYSLWWVVPIVAREVLITFLRMGWAYDGISVPAERLGKWKLLAQVATVTAGFMMVMTRDGTLPMDWDDRLAKSLDVLIVLSLALALISGFSLCWAQRAQFRSKRFSAFVLALGVGFSKFAPGTMGSLLGLLLVPLVNWNVGLHLSVLIFLALSGHYAAKHLDLGEDEDPHFVVIDEACGILLCFVGIPITWISLFAGFLLFRFFDIQKPFPIRKIEEIGGYTGVLFDDLMAAVYAWICLYLVYGGIFG
ncbi:MAG: phosphatidylglycerophosphatase A [Candidatus Omnitrophota bacterium]